MYFIFGVAALLTIGWLNAGHMMLEVAMKKSTTHTDEFTTRLPSGFPEIKHMLRYYTMTAQKIHVYLSSVQYMNHFLHEIQLQ